MAGESSGGVCGAQGDHPVRSLRHPCGRPRAIGHRPLLSTGDGGDRARRPVGGGIPADRGPGGVPHRSSAGADAAEHLAVARRVLRSGDAAGHRTALPVLGSAVGVFAGGGRGCVLDTASTPACGRRRPGGAPPGGCRGLRRAAFAQARAARRYQAVPRVRGREFPPRHADDEAFWTEWRRLHSDTLRRLETVSFLLAESWFGCRLAAAVREEAERLPAATRMWFEEFGTSPAVQRFRANKDELWLHLSLLESRRDAWRVARRRLIPSNLPPPARATSTASSRAVYAAWFAGRLRHHAVSLVTTLTSGARWWWRCRRFGG